MVIHLDELESRLGEYEYTGLVGNCVVANGCFDVLHPGHLNLLWGLQSVAYTHNAIPIVALNSDVSVSLLKGPTRPVVPQSARSQLLINLKWPFSVVVFDEETPQRLMDLLQPIAVLKGGEYAKDSVIKWKNSTVVSVQMLDGWSTTGIIGDKK